MNAPLIQDASDARLELVQAQVTESHLTLQYKLHNKSTRTMYVFNRIYSDIGPDGVFITSANAVYVDVASGKVTLSKKIIPVPPDVDVEKPNVPCATTIPPGGSITESLTISLPLRPFTAYRNIPESMLASSPSHLEAALELGAILVPPEGKKLATPVMTTNGTAFRFPSIDPTSQIVLRVEPLPVKVPVRLPK